MTSPALTAPAQLTCPECGGTMSLRTGRYGLFYGCVAYSRTGCRGVHGAHPDGRPLGTPADAETRAARVRAHQAFDQLWKHGKLSRKGAYRWMREALGLSTEEAHIGRFSLAQCEALITAVHDCEETRHG